MGKNEDVLLEDVHHFIWPSIGALPQLYVANSLVFLDIGLIYAKINKSVTLTTKPTGQYDLCYI